MNASLIEFAIAVALVFAIAASTLWYALRPGSAGAEPLIRARLKGLQQDWFQLNLTVQNLAPYSLVGVSLRRVRPRGARLMAPIQSVSRRDGDFQVWSDPEVDWPTASIPVEFVVGPHESWRSIASPGPETQITAWVFLPEGSDPERLTLELVLKDGGDNLCLSAIFSVHSGN